MIMHRTPSRSRPNVLSMARRRELLASSVFRRQLRQVYQQHGLNANQPVDLSALATAIGAPLRYVTAAASSALVHERDGQRRIIVGFYDNAHRERFAIAHEIAHALILDGIISPESLDLAPIDEEELCDMLAGLLLMPLPCFVPMVQHCANRWQGCELGQIQAIADHYQVSFTCCVLQICMLHSVHFSVWRAAPSMSGVREWEAGTFGWRGHSLLRQSFRDVRDRRTPSDASACRNTYLCGYTLHQELEHWNDEHAIVTVVGELSSRIVTQVFLRPAAAPVGA